MIRLSSRSVGGVIVLAGFTAIVGCSSRSGRVAVTGKVVVDGNPGSITVLTFVPTDPNAPPGNGGRVITDDGGNFSIGDSEKDTGLMPGDYKVTFSRFLDRNGKAVHGGGKKSESDSEPPSRESMPPTHRDAATTPVTASVSRNSTSFTFEVSTRK